MIQNWDYERIDEVLFCVLHDESWQLLFESEFFSGMRERLTAVPEQNWRTTKASFEEC